MIQRLRTLFKPTPDVPQTVMREANKSILLGHHMWKTLQFEGLHLYDSDAAARMMHFQSWEVSHRFVQQHGVVHNVLNSVTEQMEYNLRKRVVGHMDRNHATIDTILLDNAAHVAWLIDQHGSSNMQNTGQQAWHDDINSRTKTRQAIDHKHNFVAGQFGFTIPPKKDYELLLHTSDMALSGGASILSLWLKHDLPEILSPMVHTWHERDPFHLTEQEARYTITLCVMLLFHRAMYAIPMDTNVPFAWCEPLIRTYMQHPEHIRDTWRDALNVVATKNKEHHQWATKVLWGIPPTYDY